MNSERVTMVVVKEASNGRVRFGDRSGNFRGGAARREYESFGNLGFFGNWDWIGLDGVRRMGLLGGFIAW